METQWDRDHWKLKVGKSHGVLQKPFYLSRKNYSTTRREFLLVIQVKQPEQDSFNGAFHIYLINEKNIYDGYARYGGYIDGEHTIEFFSSQSTGERGEDPFNLTQRSHIVCTKTTPPSANRLYFIGKKATYDDPDYYSAKETLSNTASFFILETQLLNLISGVKSLCDLSVGTEQNYYYEGVGASALLKELVIDNAYNRFSNDGILTQFEINDNFYECTFVTPNSIGLTYRETDYSNNAIYVIDINIAVDGNNAKVFTSGIRKNFNAFPAI